MIKPAPRVPRPASLGSPRARSAAAAARKFFSRSAKERAQTTFLFDEEVYAAPEVKKALSTLFAGKCAYCESRLTSTRPLRVDQFRPMTGALALDGGFSADHYWWLAYQWENLLPACPQCIRMKGARFPVAESRAEPRAKGAALEAEKPQLLNPRRDAAEEHLVYLENGEVIPKSEPGRITVEVLGLNRTDLVAQRKGALTRFFAQWETVSERGAPQAEVEELVADAREFAAMRRQFLAEWVRADSTVVEFVPEAKEQPHVTRAEKRSLKAAHEKTQTAQEQYSVATTKKEEAYFIRTRVIERISVKNLRVIGELELDLADPTADRAPWLMFLGENGTGKSSVLQGVALALIGDRERQRLRLRPDHFLRHRARSGWVEVQLTGSPEPIRLRFTKTRFESSERQPKVLLLGYGATRLLPRAPMRSKRLTTEFGRVENLFDPFSPLGDANAWLLSLPPRTFEPVARALKGILALEEDATLRRNREAGRIEVESFGSRVPLDHLSDGYQSVLALAVDVMSVMLHRWEAMEVAEGIVLIDELGAHLHPSWRMKIVNSLRDVFPRVQFVASTHDPLCLHGLLDGEVVVLRRGPDGKVFKVADLPSVQGLRVDQLLTSEHFGLNSTIDPELDRLFKRYYELKGLWKLSAAEKKELKTLERQLEDRRVLGRTRRERLVLEAADDYLATETRPAGDGERRELRDATKKRIAKIWASTEPAEGPR